MSLRIDVSLLVACGVRGHGLSASRMRAFFSNLRAGFPDSFLIALAVCTAFMVLVGVDQSYWWLIKEDYYYGWLVPLFVAYVVSERWPEARKLFSPGENEKASPPLKLLFSLLFGSMLACGTAVFLFGAFYRAGTGASQPASLMMAVGFGALALSTLYFNTPASLVETRRAKIVALFFFPACIWVLSAPLVSAFENQLSLVLMEKVAITVTFVFEMLGIPILRMGNVLQLADGNSVGVAEACSGIRSLTGCMFAGAFLSAVMLQKPWQKILLLAASIFFAFLTNMARSLFLTFWAYKNGSGSIEGAVHDWTGFAVLGVAFLLMLGTVQLFNANTWSGVIDRMGKIDESEMKKKSQ